MAKVPARNSGFFCRLARPALDTAPFFVGDSGM
jgi:hypothetical protein